MSATALRARSFDSRTAQGQLRRHVGAALLLLSLAACGSGGGADGSAPGAGKVQPGDAGRDIHASVQPQQGAGGSPAPEAGLQERDSLSAPETEGSVPGAPETGGSVPGAGTAPVGSSAPAPVPAPVPAPAPGPVNTPAPTPTGPSIPTPAFQPAPASALGAREGAFGPVHNWPLIPLHVALLPDGRVMHYGTDQNGRQGAQLMYAVWDPSLGNGSDAHLVLPNLTGTDIFCSNQSLIPSTGELLITGGDATFYGSRNYAVPDINVFDPRSNQLRKAGTQMTQRRWYPSIVSLASGAMVVLGGSSRTVQADGTPEYGAAATPELYTPGRGWSELDGATSDDAYGFNNWYFPRGFAMPDGKVSVLHPSGAIWSLDPQGDGRIRNLGNFMNGSRETLPTAMYAPGKVLSLRSSARAFTVDMNGAAPVVEETSRVSAVRQWSNATVLANGEVLVSGGAPDDNINVDASLRVETWNPDTGRWTMGAAGQLPRLYHSVGLLLPDATVLVAGGGAPGPLNNTNAEIYYPPYLYRKDGSGQAAQRPVLLSGPSAGTWGATLNFGIRTARPIKRVTLVRHGSTTHSFNADQRFMDADFTQTGAQMQVKLPTDRKVLIPGYYMVFAFDEDGVPSVSHSVRVAD